MRRFKRRAAELEAGCLAGETTDVRTVDAEVAHAAIAHAIQFADGLTILAPIVQGACDVHGLDPLRCFASLPSAALTAIC